jgi:hypothetical protein
VLVRRLLTCFFAGAVALPVARAPRPLEPDTGPALRFLLRLAVVEEGEVLRVLRLVRFVARDRMPDFFRISLIALLTMPEINVSITPDMLACPYSDVSSLLADPARWLTPRVNPARWSAGQAHAARRPYCP